MEQDNDIDIFEFFEMLWDGKWLIITFVVLSTLVGFIYSQVVQPKYNVSAPYTINSYSVSSQQICGSDTQCLDKVTYKRIFPLLAEGWYGKNSNLYFSTTIPLEVNEYEAQMAQIGEAYKKDVYAEAITELAIIETELIDAVLSTERVSANMLNAKRLIQIIDGGRSVITFGSVSVIKSSPKVALILVFSAILGGMMGSLYILVRNASSKRKKRIS